MNLFTARAAQGKTKQTPRASNHINPDIHKIYDLATIYEFRVNNIKNYFAAGAASAGAVSAAFSSTFLPLPFLPFFTTAFFSS